MKHILVAILFGWLFMHASPGFGESSAAQDLAHSAGDPLFMPASDAPNPTTIPVTGHADNSIPRGGFDGRSTKALESHNMAEAGKQAAANTGLLLITATMPLYMQKIGMQVAGQDTSHIDEAIDILNGWADAEFQTAAEFEKKANANWANYRLLTGSFGQTGKSYGNTNGVNHWEHLPPGDPSLLSDENNQFLTDNGVDPKDFGTLVMNEDFDGVRDLLTKNIKIENAIEFDPNDDPQTMANKILTSLPSSASALSKGILATDNDAGDPASIYAGVGKGHLKGAGTKSLRQQGLEAQLAANSFALEEPLELEEGEENKQTILSADFFKEAKRKTKVTPKRKLALQSAGVISLRPQESVFNVAQTAFEHFRTYYSSFSAESKAQK